MCHSLKLLSKTKSGEFSFCKTCKIFHLEFNNLYFEFTPKQYHTFKKYILALDCQFWERKYECACLKRKIPIPSQQENLILMFNRYEIEEMRALINPKNGIKLIGLNSIDYKIILN